MHASDPFSETYAQARAKFLEAARAAGADIHSSCHDTQRGPEGEALYLHVVRPGGA